MNNDDRFVSNDPCVVAFGQRRNVARRCDELRAVVHADRQPAADVVLEVRASQLEVPTSGLTSFDQRQPGWKTRRRPRPAISEGRSMASRA